MSRVFLLEDHSWFREGLAIFLEQEADLEVVGEAGSLTEARDDVSEKAGELDLAVIDLMLPDGIGTDLIADLRRANPDLPVLVLTVAQGPDLYNWARKMGADEMMSKDASREEILGVIRLLLRG